MGSVENDIQVQLKLNKQNSFRLDIECRLPIQGVTAIFGPSGSGKTTFLRCMAGLERPEVGNINVAGECWQSTELFLPAYQRAIGYVFQEASLFEHLSAQGNLQFALNRAADPISDLFFDEIIDLLGLKKLLNRYPNELSGGERQRVAIARALLIQPQILLMDEPLASLDQSRREEIIPYLSKLRKTLSIPILYVTHSIDEIVQFADHILVLEEGRQMAEGPVTDVLSRSDLSAFSGYNTGCLWEGKVVERSDDWHLAKIECFSDVFLWVKDTGVDVGETLRVRILARDVSLTLSEDNSTSILNKLSAKVVNVTDDQDRAMVLVRLHCESGFLIARITKRSANELGIFVGVNVFAQVKSVALVC